MALDDAQRWAAVVRRDAAFDGQFVYCVKSTTIYCRPICKARLARRMNVIFCDTAGQAEALGYRACKRCRPQLATAWNPEGDKIRKACDLLRGLPCGAPLPGLEKLAQAAGLTKHHFHRLFKREMGCTPREYALACRGEKTGSATPATDDFCPVTPVTSDQSDAPVEVAGEPEVDVDWSSLVNEHDLYSFDLIGFTLDGAETTDLSIDQVEILVVYYDVVNTMFGKLLVAFQDDRVCKLELGTSEAELMANLETGFSSLYYVHAQVSTAGGTAALAYKQRIDAIVNALEHPIGKTVDVPLSLDVTEATSTAYGVT